MIVPHKLTHILLSCSLLSGGGLQYTFVARPAFHIGMVGLLSIFWLGGCPFITHALFTCIICRLTPFLQRSMRSLLRAGATYPSHARSYQMVGHNKKAAVWTCDADICIEYADERGWCQEVQALKAFVWILFTVGMSVITDQLLAVPASISLPISPVSITTMFVVQHAFSQHSHGNRQMWKFSLMHFDPRSAAHQGHARTTSVTAGYFGRAASSYIPGIDSKW